MGHGFLGNSLRKVLPRETRAAAISCAVLWDSTYPAPAPPPQEYSAALLFGLVVGFLLLMLLASALLDVLDERRADREFAQHMARRLQRESDQERQRLIDQAGRKPWQ